MGAGIAQVLLESGADVTVVESGADRVSAAGERVADGVRRRLKRDDDAESTAAERLARLTVVDGLAAAAERDAAPALVVEAVPEDVDLKRAVLADVQRHLPDTSLVASNTSSLSIGSLAEGLDHPERFCGMHFFNPVPRSKLVEVIRGDATSSDTVDAAVAWVARLDKEAIVVGDSPGFATSRLGVVIGLEAIRMVEAGVASADDIDQGMVLGYGFPMGPLRLTDLVGLDVRLGIAEHLARTLGPRFEPPQLLRDMVAAGNLGQKTGQGFYTWP
mgnify:CR=1 FL=1